MFKVLGLCLVFVLSTNCLAAQFGQKISLTKSVPLNELISLADANKGKAVLTTAKVEKICVKKGCWMQIKSDDLSIRVTFKDYGFFVPNKILGKMAQIQGELIKKTVSVKEQKHFLEDAGEPEKAKSVTKPKMEYRFIASGVEY